MMRKILLMSALLALPVGYTCMADDSENTPIDLNDKGLRPTKRPKAPSAQRVTASVANGVLFINFAISEGECQMTITSPEQILEFSFDSADPLMLNIGELHDFQISIITENGNCYESDTIATSI
ncbi:MAG: hypothetical protein K2K82_09355 [Muribaculaceae bacterium]|nr:hypothetical protein [Muribaculaceae bacterium]